MRLFIVMLALLLTVWEAGRALPAHLRELASFGTVHAQHALSLSSGIHLLALCKGAVLGGVLGGALIVGLLRSSSVWLSVLRSSFSLCTVGAALVAGLLICVESIALAMATGFEDQAHISTESSLAGVVVANFTMLVGAALVLTEWMGDLWRSLFPDHEG